MTAYRLTPAARRELADIWLYTANHWGMDQADAYTGRIEADIARAVEHPAIGSSLTGLPPAYRKLKSGSHRIVYRHTGDELIVVRILHERQDVPDDWEDLW